MKTIPQPTGGVVSETHELYLHLLNLKREDGEPATDRSGLHREIAESPELRETLLDAAALGRYISGDQEIAADHLEALRVALDRAHRKAVDPKFNWKPRWLNAPQGIRHAHPSITDHALHHHPFGS
jgi:hypothetical protein